MLRLFVLALVLANGAWFAWSHGYLHSLGLEPATQREPERQSNQIYPQNIRLLNPQELAVLEASAKAQVDAAATACQQAGPLNAQQAAALRKVLAVELAPTSWELQTLKQPERWIVYMGTYDNAAQLRKKRAEVAAMQIPMEPLRNAALEPGISLGGFASRAQAKDLLAERVKQGIHTARVVQELEAGTAYQLQLPALTDAVKDKLPQIKAALADVSLRPCAAAEGSHEASLP